MFSAYLSDPEIARLCSPEQFVRQMLAFEIGLATAPIAWMLEWENLPRMMLNAGTALRHALSITQTMGVDAEAMKRNLNVLARR